MATVLHDVVRVEREGAVVTATITHPPVNAVSRAVIAGLGDALSDAEGDPSVHVMVITGEGPKFFAAGADITEFGGGDPGAMAQAGQHLTLRLESSRLGTIAAVNGIAFGGGCEVVLACDIRLASSSARFGQPEINLGIIPGWGGTQRLPRLIGRGPAMPLLLTGDPIDAARAYEIGLVAEVVDPEALPATARAWAEKLAGKAPMALAATKRAVVAGLDRPLPDGLDREASEFAAIFATDDAQEGVAAFLEKRKAVWRGR